MKYTMKYTGSIFVLTVALLLVTHQSDATIKKLLRRQSNDSEQEGTPINNQGQQVGLDHPRLYPDLSQQSSPFIPPFGSQNYPPNYAPTPFVPFGMQMSPNRISDPQLKPQPRPMTQSDRLQSQTFVNGLGRRLLSMVGVDSPSNETSIELSENSGQISPTQFNPEETMKALQNSTVLKQLNRGVYSIYGSLSKMYNSTVQQQLDLLQERFRKEAENSTNPWRQRMAQQVPQFFKMMALRVEEAQNNLNHIWRQVTQANNGTLDRTSYGSAPRSSLNSRDQQTGNIPYDENILQQGNFFNQIGRSFGFSDQMNPNVRQDPNDPQQKGFDNQLKHFWLHQVQPQIGMLGGQIARVWRDMTTSGALMPNTMVRVRNNGINLSGSSNDTASSDIVDNILKEVDLESQEYALVEARNDQQGSSQEQQNQSGGKPYIESQMRNGLISMQRKLNQLWNGLTNSLQGALVNVRTSMNPRPQFRVINTTASSENKQEDREENEINGKIKDLFKLQKDADTVYDVVQQQQQEQQRPNFADKFKNFFNSVDFGNMDQLPVRFGESVSNFGNVVGDLWHQIPGRWDNFMQNMRQQDLMNATNSVRKPPTSTTQKPSSMVADT